jgi:hypothetical protein
MQSFEMGVLDMTIKATTFRDGLLHLIKDRASFECAVPNHMNRVIVEVDGYLSGNPIATLRYRSKKAILNDDDYTAIRDRLTYLTIMDHGWGMTHLFRFESEVDELYALMQHDLAAL